MSNEKKDSKPIAGTPPEVEAEVVVDEPATSAQPFNSDADSDTPADDISQAKSDQDSAPPPRRGGGFGVVIFVLLVILSLSAIAYWYISTGSPSLTTAPPSTSETTEQVASDQPNENKTPPDTLEASAPPAREANDATTARIALPENDANTEGTLQDNPFTNIAELDLDPSADLTTSKNDSVNDNDTIVASPQTDAPVDNSEATSGNLETAPATTTLEEIVPAESPTLELPKDTVAAEISDGITAQEAKSMQARDEIAALEEAIRQMQENVDNAQTEIAALRTRNRELEGEIAALPAPVDIAAMRALTEAAHHGAPFDQELATLKSYAPNAAAITALESFASKGAPSTKELRERFKDAARDGLAIARRETADTLVERYIARAAGVVGLRPADPQDGEHPAAIISRAEYAVDAENFTVAISEINGLPDSAKDAMKNWVEDTQTRIAIDNAMIALSEEIAARPSGEY